MNMEFNGKTYTPKDVTNVFMVFKDGTVALISPSEFENMLANTAISALKSYDNMTNLTNDLLDEATKKEADKSRKPKGKK